MSGTSTKTSRMTFRIPNELLAELRREAADRGLSVAAVVIESLRRSADAFGQKAEAG